MRAYSTRQLSQLCPSLLMLNAVSLTFAIQMADNVYSYGADGTIQDAFIKFLDPQNGMQVLKNILQNNPQLSANTNHQTTSMRIRLYLRAPSIDRRCVCI
ncbi:hypothetical protein V1521DRAFT_74578 [Lipomyces starkeyi]